MIFAYLRVSSKSQSLSRQRQMVEEYATSKGLTIDRIFEEKQSGKDFNREVYQAMKLTLRIKDVLIICELDRLGRDMAAIKTEWRELEQLGVDIVVLDTPMLSTTDRSDLEKSLIANIVFELLSYLSEKERQKLRARQADGIRIAREKGKYRGRKPIAVPADAFESVYTRWRAEEITAKKAMELLGVKKDKFYTLVKERAEK